MRFAEFTALALRPERFPLVVNSVPDIEQREEVRLRIKKAFVRGRGGNWLLSAIQQV